METRYIYDTVNFENSLRTGFIDASIDSDTKLRPRFLSNDRESATNLLAVIKSQLRECKSFDFSIAFVAESGLQTLIEALNELRDRGIRGRFLTSTYLNFNSPDALRKLLEYPNIETRVYQGSMHAKGYFFNNDNLSTVIIGSSNLTQTALTCNKEWNVLFRSYDSGEMLSTARREFDALWDNDVTVPLTEDWIERYRNYRLKAAEAALRPPRQAAFTDPFDGCQEPGIAPAEAPTTAIKPNKMQKHALEALKVIHDRGENRALLISATGTGKTYLSALDVAATAPKRVLFLAHRKRILTASERSFRNVLGSSYTYEQLESGHAPQASCSFGMMLSVAKHLDDFDPEYFDYIIIDEAHRAGSKSYQDILSHFKPKFFLGMTATPERSDGYDVFRLFNHVIAYRITLQDALENNMLAPFHYFGIADLEINDQTVDDPTMFSHLASEERAEHIMSKIEEYTVAKTTRRGLIFCNRNDEARELSAKFNEHGYKTTALSGSDSDEIRDRAIARLESGELEYIFSVDIFNEGIDIPSINQVIMLRRTDSAIVFVQQLGRGLRKATDKEYTLVLDFIGNYQSNYFVPIALSGDRTYNKDGLRAFIKEGSTVVPGASTISFDRISESRIFRAIDGGRFGATDLIKSEYTHLKHTLGRIPSLLDFDENDALDPLIIFRTFGSYHAFLKKYEKDYTGSLDEYSERILKFVSQKLAAGKRSDELEILSVLLDGFETGETIPRASCRKESAAWFLDGSFFNGREPAFIESTHNGTVKASEEFNAALASSTLREHLRDAVDFGLSRYRSQYANRYKDTDLVLYSKYTYEDTCRLLGWKRSVSGQNIGGYKFDADTATFPVFINYDKSPDISATIAYEDRFLSDTEMIAISKQPRYLNSPEIKRLQAWTESTMRIYLFVRKNKDDKDGGKEFYFLGEMAPTGDFEAITMPGTTKAAVEIGYRLETPVRADLYDYITSSFSE